MVAFDVLDLRVHGEPASEGNRKVVAEGAELAALVGEVVDELAILAIFAGENLLELKYRSIGMG